MTAPIKIIELLPGEMWWGGSVTDGVRMPFGVGSTRFERDLADPAINNQAASRHISSAGRVISSTDPFSIAIDDSLGVLRIAGDFRLQSAPGTTLAGAAGLLRSLDSVPRPRPALPALMVTAPQYNTWIQMPYRPTQDLVLGYALDVLDSGLPPGVLMIDDNWSPAYGTWEFDTGRFPEAKAMVDQLHELGFAVMLWVVPFISPDTSTFRKLSQQDLLVRDHQGAVALREWWNGYSAVLDLSNPEAAGWMTDQLDELVNQHGVDGFKFDAGDIRFYRDDDRTHSPTSPAGQCLAWSQLGAKYSFNEFRASWNAAHLPLAQRLHDKPPSWDDRGLRSLIPEGITQSLLGYSANCADMIGGGLLSDFEDPGFRLDQELFVRYAQLAALFPMMQFSLLPSRVLDQRYQRAVLRSVQLHAVLEPYLSNLHLTGMPIMRPMNYSAPEWPYLADQFMLGDLILCAPVLDKGATNRSVWLPPGSWIDFNGRRVDGGATLTIEVDLDAIPHFFNVDALSTAPPSLAQHVRDLTRPDRATI